ncbi:hypothetical protein H5410_021703 [Solanum commersonii]|uniref:Uncharacterized protein n=1 Tax=Solanum commersonii TaxID=4109 RepID=A0A9J5ZHY9_SOLCO|nr:hypothetical protein H5410_021703 [Solanum commersonii]
MQKNGYNCQLKDLVMSYIPHFFHNEKVLPFKITYHPSLLVYLGGAERPPILRVYVDEIPIEEDYNLEEDQQDMLNDEFDAVDMNNHDAEIGKDEVLDFESNNHPTPIVGSNIPCPPTRDMSNQLRTELGCKVSYWKFYKGMEHAKSNVRGTHEHRYAVFNVYLTKFEDPLCGSSKARPRRTSRAVVITTDRGSSRGKLQGKTTEVFTGREDLDGKDGRLLLVLGYWDSDYCDQLEVVHFDLEIIKWLLIYQAFCPGNRYIIVYTISFEFII